LAFLTAIAASAIVIGEVAGEEQEIEKQEGQILDILREIDARLERLEHLRHHACLSGHPAHRKRARCGSDGRMSSRSGGESRPAVGPPAEPPWRPGR